MNLEQLRRRTKGLHDSLERMPFAQNLVGGQNLTEYLASLRGLRRLYSGYLPVLEDFFPSWLACWRKRLIRLADDMRGEVKEAPSEMALWHGGSKAEAVGIAYVCEGSLLGGRVIRRRLMAGACHEVRARMSFFEGQDDRQHERFSQVLECIEAFQTEELESCIQAALFTFDVAMESMACEFPSKAGGHYAASMAGLRGGTPASSMTKSDVI